jgi:HEAT repeat protein
MEYAKHLIERIASAPEHERVGVLSTELLREFHRGYPLDDLRQLLSSKDENLVAVAVWIVSELGEKSRPLLGDLVHLLVHPVKGIRFWAVDGLFWTLPHNGCDLAEAFKLLDDPESGVRWKVLDVLSRLSREQIGAAYGCLEARGSDSSHLLGLRWLLSDQALAPASIVTALRNADPIVRKYALVAAVRLRKEHPEALIYASTVDDADVRKIASDLLAD